MSHSQLSNLLPLHSLNGFQSFWGDLRAPPLPFRRRPPQSNCPPNNVPYPVNGLGLETKLHKRGIPPAAPPRLASRLLCLPPILYMCNLIPILSCSKAPWGLSVLSQVASIFTGCSISPGVLSRQRPNRYAFRAGQNLPDKEFRYLRTVIVTAAVYWGLSSKLRIAPNLSLWPSSTGQASAPILHLAVLQKPVFLINSRLGLFSVSSLRWNPFSLSYGVILPSSLTTLLPSACGFSPRLPVSVYGTGTHIAIAAFLGSVDSETSLLFFTPLHTSETIKGFSS